MAMKKMYIHIGYHKTGTTSIQRFFFQHREELKSQGFCYPKTGLVDSAHHRLAISINQESGFQSLLKNSAEVYWNDLFEEFERSSCHTLIVSSEVFSTNSKTELIELIKEKIPSNIDVKILVYLRRIDLYVESIYKQLVTFYESRRKEMFDIDAPFVRNRINCYEALNRWATVFGKQSVIVRVFEKEQLRFNPIYDLLCAVDYQGPLLCPKKTDRRDNASLSSDCTEILRRINSTVDLSRESHDALVEFLQRVSKTIRNDNGYLTPDERIQLNELSRPYDEKIAREFLGRAEGRLYQAEMSLESRPVMQFDRIKIPSELRALVDAVTASDDHRLFARKQISKNFDSINIDKNSRGVCTVCGNLSVFGFRKNLRDSGNCSTCGANNRKRQIALVFRRVFNLPVTAAGLAVDKDVNIFNTETKGALHQILSRNAGYVGAEFFGPEYVSGTMVDGIRHEDLCSLSFESNFLHAVISSDVFEHIPTPYKAHEEVFRVLKPGGVHIFTVPFQTHQLSDETHAEIVDGNIKFHRAPVYHGDPHTKEGRILVYNIFGFEMLLKLEKIGFLVDAIQLYEPSFGIVGKDAIVFTAKKPAAAEKL